MRNKFLHILCMQLFIPFSLLLAQQSTMEDLQSEVNLLKKQVEILKAEKEKEAAVSELEELLQDAGAMAQEKKKDENLTTRVFRGGQRQLQALNPNISLTGDFVGSITSGNSSLLIEPSEFTDGRNRFTMREAEFHIIAPLDPFTRGKFFMGVPGDGSLEIEEAYMEWLNLPANINLKIGKFLHQFGILNRWHTHGLPQIDRPSALTNLFGMDGLAGTGLSANILLPPLLAHVNSLDLEISTGGDGICFSDTGNNILLVGHLKNYYDVNRNSYIEIGLSGAQGFNDNALKYQTQLAGLDLAYKWVPIGREHYRAIECRNEIIFSRMETVQGNRDRLNLYSYISNRLGMRYWVGLRYSYSELPWDAAKKTEWDLSPTLDFWQSEFVMLRLQYSYTQRSYAENDYSIMLQTVWSMGPHKHEAY